LEGDLGSEKLLYKFSFSLNGYFQEISSQAKTLSVITDCALFISKRRSRNNFGKIPVFQKITPQNAFPKTDLGIFYGFGKLFLEKFHFKPRTFLSRLDR